MKLLQSEIKYLRSLQQKKFRESEQKFLLEGWRPLYDALHSSFQIEYIILHPKEKENRDHRLLLALAKERNIPVKECTEKQLTQVSDTVHSQGVLALIHQEKKRFDSAHIPAGRLMVACDRINDPGNVGTIIRTCDWFAADAILLSEGCVSLYNEKVIRSTAGSLFHVPVYEGVDLASAIQALKGEGFKIIAAALNGKPLPESPVPEKAILLLGNEAAGIHPQLITFADSVVSIPRHGSAESLNVGIAGGIILNQWRNR